MPIVFEPLDSANSVSITELRLLLALESRSMAIAAGTSETLLTLLLSLEAEAEQFFGGDDLEPEIPNVTDFTFYVSADAELYTTITSDTELLINLYSESYLGAAGSSFAELALAVHTEALVGFETSSYGFLVEQPAVISGYGGMVYAQLDDALIVQDASFADFIALLRDSVSFSDQFSVLFKVLATIDDSLVVRDFVTYVAVAQVNDGFDIATLSTGELRIVGLIADQLIVNDDSIPWLSAVHTILAAMSFRDALVAGRDGTIDSTVALLAEFEARIAAVGTLVAEVALADEFQSGLVLFALLTSDLVLADDWQTNVAAIAEILDGFSLGVRFTVGDDTYIGYTVNTKNSAVSAYENYAFNSLTLIGGKPYGAGTDGIYALDDGDTDDGDPIAARLRLGVSNFGTMLGKRVPHAYVGYTSDGSLVLKTITMDGGSKKENWYRMKKRPEGAPAESRFDPAKGLQGVYWGFELVNEAGADFTLDTLQVYPVIINRRYSGR